MKLRSPPPLLVGMIVGVLVTLAALWAADLYVGMQTRVEVLNGTDEKFNVEIKVAGDLVWQGSIDDHAWHKVSHRARGDGEVELFIRKANGELITERFGYVTNYLGDRYFVSVRPPAEVRIVQCNGGIFIRLCVG